MASDTYGCAILMLISSLFCFFPTTLLIIIHIRKPILRVGFFNVIFGTIIIEFLIHLLLMINSITVMISPQDTTIFLVLGFLNDFLFSTHIGYYLIMTCSFIGKSKTKEPLIDKDLDSSRATLNLKAQSFNHIHIISFFLGVIHAIASISTMSIDIFIIPFSFISLMKIGSYVFIFFIYHLAYFIMSILYWSISMNKFKISSHIRLKNYSVYCLIASTMWLILPIDFVVEAFGQEVNYTALRYVSTLIFLALMILNTFFHFKRYYVSYLIDTNGLNFFWKLLYYLRMLLCIEHLDDLNFVDFNSTYIFHSLCTENDLASERDEANSELSLQEE